MKKMHRSIFIIFKVSVVVLLLIGCINIVIGQGKEPDSSVKFSGKGCRGENIVTNTIESDYIAYNGDINGVAKWTFCDGVVVIETRKSYNFLLEFNKEFDNLIKQGGELEKQKVIKNKEREIGMEYLISSLASFEKSWTYIYRDGVKTTKFEGNSLIHVLYLAEMWKNEVCKKSMENQTQ
jgi:hypothetical protein